MDRNLLIAVVGVIVVVIIVAAFAVFLTPQEVPMSKRLKTERLVKVVNVSRVNFASPGADLGELTGNVFVCPDGSAVASEDNCTVSEVSDEDTVNCDYTVVEWVCGENGVPYLNSCFAQADGEENFVPGFCESIADDIDAAEDDGAGGVDCTLDSSNPECLDGADGTDDGTGDGTDTDGADDGTGENDGADDGTGDTDDQAAACVDEPKTGAVDAVVDQTSCYKFTLNHGVISYVQAIGTVSAMNIYSKFVLFNVTLENTGTASIPNPVTDMKLAYNSDIAREYNCNARVTGSSILPGSFLATPLAAGETRTGLVACEADDKATDLQFKYKSTIVPLPDASASDLLSSATYSGAETSFIGNGYSPILVKVNRVDTWIPSSSTDKFRDTLAIPISLCINDESNNGGKCGVLILDVTVKNNVEAPVPQTFDMKYLVIKFGDDTDSYYKNAQQLLDQKLDSCLSNMPYEGECTGQIAYVIGSGTINHNVPVTFTINRESASTQYASYPGNLEIKVRG